MAFQQGAFLIDANETPQSLAKKRAMLQSMMMQYGKASNVGEGVGQLFNGIAVGAQNRKLEGAEKAGMEAGNAARDKIYAMLTGGNPAGNFPPAPTAQPAPQQAAPAMAQPQAASPMQVPMPNQDSPVANAPSQKALSDWLVYGNQGKTRNLPLDKKLVDALSFLPEMGIAANVVSGGQPQKGTGLARIGSTRHDNGLAADVFFTKDGRKLDWNNPDDLPIFQDIVRKGKERGLTGFGAGPGYMAPGSMHVGFGNPMVWGAKGKSDNAPQWLRDAYNGAQQQAQQAAPQQMAQAAPAPEMAGNAPQQAPGGLNLAELMKAAQNPWLPAGDREFVNSLIQKEMSKNDPAAMQERQLRELQLRKAQMEVDSPDTVVVNGSLVDRRTGKVVYQSPDNPAKGDEFGLQPFMARDENGNLVPYQLSKSGKLKKVELPQGQAPAPNIQYLDTGTGYMPADKRGGIVPQGVAPVDKNLAGAEAEKIKGKTQGEKIAAAPGDIMAGQNALELIQSIRNDPGRERGTGMTAIANRVPGTAGYDFNRKVEQAKSGAFMTAIQSLRGMGALSNAEGQTATAAVTRMDTAMSEEGFLEALNDYEKLINQALSRAQGNVEASPAAPAPAAAPAKQRLKFNPQTGELE